MPSHLSNPDHHPTTEFAGIDVGARRLHAVAIDGAGRLACSQIFEADDIERLLSWAAGASCIAIDSPDGWSTAPHADDATLSPKFRSARCGEVALGRTLGVWVPWTTPVRAAQAPQWMRAGVELFAALWGAGHLTLEVYPHAAFRLLNGGGPLPNKRTPAGAARRRQLLVRAGILGAHGIAPHHVLDAAVAALVARHHVLGTATAATCGHDGSAIWLPAS